MIDSQILGDLIEGSTDVRCGDNNEEGIDFTGGG